MNESTHLFVNLQPPSGGLQRLQRTLGSRRINTQTSSWRMAFGSLAVATLALVCWLPGIVAQHRQTAELVSAIRAATALPANGIEIINGDAVELPSGQPNARLYLVQSAPPPASTGTH